MTYVNRKFKCKDHDTLYEILGLENGLYLIQWRKSDGSFDKAENSISSVENAFEQGAWHFVDGLGMQGGKSEAEHTGGSVNYYKVHVANPTTLPEAYDAEANDIIESLGLTFAEGNLFKAIWRMAADRNGKKKKGNNSVYDAEKLVFFAERVLVQEKAKRDETI
jgi:hypothetical protein